MLSLLRIFAPDRPAPSANPGIGPSPAAMILASIAYRHGPISIRRAAQALYLVDWRLAIRGRPPATGLPWSNGGYGIPVSPGFESAIFSGGLLERPAGRPGDANRIINRPAAAPGLEPQLRAAVAHVVDILEAVGQIRKISLPLQDYPAAPEPPQIDRLVNSTYPFSRLRPGEIFDLVELGKLYAGETLPHGLVIVGK